MMEPNPYSQSAQDPTQQQGLLQILQQIQALQNRPLIPDNPLSQLGAALQGASAGFAGQPNPAIQQAMAQRQQQMAGLTNTASIMGSLASMQHQQATLAETRRAHAAQEARAEKSEERLREDAALKIADSSWKKALDLGDADTAAVVYDTLTKKLPGYFPPMPPEKVRTLVGDKIARESFKQNQVGMATAAFLGLPTFLGKPIPQDVAAMPKRALALLAGKSEEELLHGSLDAWQIALRKKVAQVGFEALTPDERAEFLALEGRGASDARKAAIANIQDDITAHGKIQKPLGEYFRVAREFADLGQPLKEALKGKGITQPTSQQIEAARQQLREENAIDAARKNLKRMAVEEMNARAGGKKNLHLQFKHLPDDFVKQLALGDENVLMQLLGALGVTMKPPTGSAATAPAGGALLKNGKTREQAIQDGMSGGAGRAEAEREVQRLINAGQL